MGNVREDLAMGLALRRANDHQWFSFDETDGVRVHILLETAFDEARHRGVPLGGKYSARLDPAHTPSDQRHIHVYARRNELFALNLDGSTRHGLAGQPIPSRVASAIGLRWPEWRLPADNILEWCAPAPPWLRHTLAV